MSYKYYNIMILIHKKCKSKNCKFISVSIYGSNKYCRDHTIKRCCMNNEKNIYNEVRCNTTIKMMKLKGKTYCNSHFRTLISTCQHPNCNVERDSNYINFDKFWYCDNHKPKENKFLFNMIHAFRQKNLPVDIISKICKKHLNNETYFV